MLGRRGTLPFLVVPPYLGLLLLFVVPIGAVVAISLLPASGRINFGTGWPSTIQYERVFETASYFRLLGTSMGVALVVAAASTILAYPLAYFLTFRARRYAAILLVLLLIPFATSYLLRIMAWKLMLGRDGAINSFLVWLGAVNEPSPMLIYSQAAVVITLIYVWIPFAALPIYAALGRIDRSHLEAAADLGAGPWSRFGRITLPLSLPGALASFFMVFIPTAGEYVTPSLVGGTDGIMFGNLIQDFFTRGGNWPQGAAFAVILLVATVLLVAIAVRLVDVRRIAT